MDKKIILGVVIGIVAILCVGGYYTLGLKGTNTTPNTTHNAIPAYQNETEIRLSSSDLSTTAKFYSYDSKGVTIQYFAMKDSLGNVHVAFNACDVCYAAKKGYKQVGDVMQCLNCGKEFAVTSIGSENTAGGCWPSYLPMMINGNDVVIKISDLDAKSFMF